MSPQRYPTLPSVKCRAARPSTRRDPATRAGSRSSYVIATRSAGAAVAAPLVDVVPGAVHEVVSDRALQLGAVVHDDVRERIDRQRRDALGQGGVALVRQVLALALVELLVGLRERLVDLRVRQARPVRTGGLVGRRDRSRAEGLALGRVR